VSVSVADKSRDIEEVTAKEVLKDVQDNIDVCQLENSRQISKSRQIRQAMKEVPHTDPDLGNGTQTSEIFKRSGKLNIFFASNLLCQNQKSALN
jgi:hypothetical protein